MHIQYLGSDSLRGREPGTRGGELAADYIAEQLAAYGLAPAGPDGSYFQGVPTHGSRTLPGTRLTIVRDGPSTDLNYGDDYLLYSGGDATHIARPVPLIFVGYGIVAPEYDYSDYQNVVVRGAVVLFLAGEPASKDPRYFDGDPLTWHAMAEVKRNVALSHGARGTIQLPAPGDGARLRVLDRDRPAGAPLSRREAEQQGWERKQEFGTEYRTLAYAPPEQFAALLNPRVAASIFASAPFSYDDVCRMDSLGEMRSFPLRARMSFRGRFHGREFISPNVAAVLRGVDPLQRDSYLILSAHYDGLGIGSPIEDDSIYNGVIDNASGVAALLEMARSMSGRAERPARSVLFLFLTGEETGLLGSRYYCDHPLVPLHRTSAALNVDGIAFLDTFEDVVGVGAEHSTLGDALAGVAARLGLSISPIPSAFQVRDEFQRSDQYAFAQAGIPSILIQEGLRFTNLSSEDGLWRYLDWGLRVYHSPFDDLHQPVRMEASLEHIRVLQAMADTLACGTFEPQWQAHSPFLMARLRSIAEGR
jgi:hypothetical protein